MTTENTTSITLDLKTQEDIQKLRKAFENIIFVSLIGFVLPIVFPCMIALGLIYAMRRRKILSNQTVTEWLSDNAQADLNRVAKQATVEGGIARIKISTWRPWIPMFIPIAAVAVFVMVAYATGTM
jgi:hypothetical protein